MAEPSSMQDAVVDPDRLHGLIDEGLSGKGELWDAEEIKRLGRTKIEAED